MIPNSLGGSPELVRLQLFRETLYSDVLTRGREALFELLDALLDLGPVPSFVELCLSPFFRREWPSVYAALGEGRIDSGAWRQLSREYLPEAERLLLVVDVTTWLLPEAETLPERGVHHVATSLCTKEKLGIGYAYSTLGVVPEAEGSWFLPLAQKRVVPSRNNLEVAAEQLREEAKSLPGRAVAVLDSEYGNGTFLDLLAPLEQPLKPNAKRWTVADPADSTVDVLARLAGNRTFYRRPPAYAGQGRPRVHGAAFRMQGASTWPKPDQEEWVCDRKWGLVHLRAWHHLHSEDHPWREVTLVLVERPGASGSGRQPKRIWLLWYGTTMPSLETLWRWYERRFSVEHWHRFGKQTLNWTRPHLGAPERLDRWGQVVMLATCELWLARPIPVGEVKRWQKRPADPQGRTPGQVRQGMRALLGVLGTPVPPPQPRGRARGRWKGQSPGRKTRYEVVKKARKGRAGAGGTQTATAQTA